MEPWGSLRAFRIVDGQINPTLLSRNTPQILSSYAGIAVSAKGDEDGTAIVWQTTGDYDTRGISGTLHAFDAANLSQEIWNSDMVSRDTLGGFARFVAPTVVNGRVYVPTSSNALLIYGLLDSGRLDAAVKNRRSSGGDKVCRSLARWKQADEACGSLVKSSPQTRRTSWTQRASDHSAP